MKLVTIKDVAKEAGVSISVVSYVLNNNPNVSITDKTRSKVLDAAKKLNYKPNSIARSMRTKKTMMICLATFWDVSDSVFTDVLKGVDNIAEENQYSVIYCNIKDHTTSQKIIDLYKQRQIDGVILLLHVDPMENFDEADFIRHIKQNHVPAVIINGRTEDLELNYVYIDYYSSTYTAVRFLYQIGHRRMCYILPDEHEVSSIQAVQRIEGYKDAVKDFGLTKSDLYFDNETLIKHIDLFKSDRKPTAVIVNKTAYAASLLRTFAENHIKVPEDISVVACNDQSTANYLTPALTTVRIPIYEIGETSAGILFELLKGNSSIIKQKLSNEVVERKSHRKI
mgnify:CR=1 FL=1